MGCFLILFLCIFSLKKFYAVGDPVYARDLWLVVELGNTLHIMNSLLQIILVQTF